MLFFLNSLKYKKKTKKTQPIAIKRIPGLLPSFSQICFLTKFLHKKVKVKIMFIVAVWLFLIFCFSFLSLSLSFFFLFSCYVKQIVGGFYLFWEDSFLVFKDSTLLDLKNTQVQIIIFDKKAILKISKISNSKSPPGNLVTFNSEFLVLLRVKL